MSSHEEEESNMPLDENQEDWKSYIDFNDDHFVLDVFCYCPDLDFPAEWLKALYPKWNERLHDYVDGEIYYDPEINLYPVTPDGASLKDWVENPRLCVLRPEKNKKFEEYSVYVDGILYDYTLWVRYQHWRMPTLDSLVDELSEFREAFSDDELQRFQEEYLRRDVYEYIRVGLHNDLRHLTAIRETLKFVEGVLEAILEDDMGDLVWPGENRMEWRR